MQSKVSENSINLAMLRAEAAVTARDWNAFDVMNVLKPVMDAQATCPALQPAALASLAMQSPTVTTSIRGTWASDEAGVAANSIHMCAFSANIALGLKGQQAVGVITATHTASTTRRGLAVQVHQSGDGSLGQNSWACVGLEDMTQSFDTSIDVTVLPVDVPEGIENSLHVLSHCALWLASGNSSGLALDATVESSRGTNMSCPRIGTSTWSDGIPSDYAALYEVPSLNQAACMQGKTS